MHSYQFFHVVYLLLINLQCLIVPNEKHLLWGTVEYVCVWVGACVILMCVGEFKGDISDPILLTTLYQIIFGGLLGYFFSYTYTCM